MGLLDAFNSPEMGLAMGLLNAGGASSRPVSLGQGIAQGYQGFQQAQENNQQRAAREQQMQMRTLQMKQMQDAQKADQEAKAGLQSYLGQLQTTEPQKAGQIIQALKMGVPAVKVWEHLNPKQEDYTLGDQRFNGATNQVKATAAPKSAPTELARLIGERDALPMDHPNRKLYQDEIGKLTTHAPPIAVNNYPQPMAVTKPDGTVGMVQFGNKGDMRETPYTPAPAAKEPKSPTEFEGKAAFYAGNMKAASKVLDKLESEGMNMAKLGNQLDTASAGGVGNFVASPRAQQARQAMKQWAEQMLRMQTGAAATESEIARTVSTYFPQIGDSDQVVTQKREQRAQAESGIQSASGRAESRIQNQTKPSTTFDAMPPAQKYKGKRIQGDDGTTYRSDGMRWVKE